MKVAREWQDFSSSPPKSFWTSALAEFGILQGLRQSKALSLEATRLMYPSRYASVMDPAVSGRVSQSEVADLALQACQCDMYQAHVGSCTRREITWEIHEMRCVVTQAREDSCGSFWDNYLGNVRLALRGRNLAL